MHADKRRFYIIIISEYLRESVAEGGFTMIRITSKQHNFRRCRVAHPKGTTEYPDDTFSPEQLKVLETEPKLTVEIIDEEPELTVREIKERLEEMEVEFSPKAKKEELQKLLAEKLSEIELDTE